MIGQNTFVALGRAKQAVFFSLWRKVVLVMPLMLVFPRFWGPATPGKASSSSHTTTLYARQDTVRKRMLSRTRPYRPAPWL